MSEIATLTYNTQQIGDIGVIAQQFVKWTIQNTEMIGPGGMFTIAVSQFESFAIYPTVLYVGDGNVHIIDRGENIWPLRSFIAKTLDRLIKDEFLVSQMTLIEDLSKQLHFLVYFFSGVMFFLDTIELRFKTNDEYFEYFCAQFSSWYGIKLGHVIHYSEFANWR